MVNQLLLLLCVFAIATCHPARKKKATEYEDDNYHPTLKMLKRSDGEPSSPSPWDETDWNALAKSELQNAINVAENINKNKAKNVIFFIGDGMGISTLASARLYHAETRNLQKTDIYLPWERFPHVALSRTYNVDRMTPDSAATATAYLCGVKANMRTIGVNDNVAIDSCEDVAENEVRSILTESIAADKWTGIVTTTRITHASPAGAYAHVANRDWEASVPSSVPNYEQCDDIAKQLITDEENQKIRVLLGGGSRMLLPEDESGSREDGRNLIHEWWETRLANAESFEYVQDKAEFDSVDANSVDYLLGLFNSDHMDYEVDRIKKDPIDQPSLTEMTEKAIQLLQRSPNGYFLFVEGGRIDMAHHTSRAFKALNDTIALSDAVQRAIDLTQSDDTLIIVSADHSHVFTFGGYGSFSQSVLDFTDGIQAKDGKPALQLNYANGPSYPYHRMVDDIEVPRKDLTGVDVKDPEFQQDTGIYTRSETHGGEDVAIFASGPMSHLFHGNHEENYIAHVMMYASCVGDYRSEAHCTD